MNHKADATNMAHNTNPTNKTKKFSKRGIIIAIFIGAVALGGIAGGVYLITRHNNSDSGTIVRSDTDSEIGSTTLAEGTNKITSGGTYTFTGSINNGKITVDATDPVKIILNNVSITNSEGAAIKCQEGSNVTIELVGKNTLTSTDKGTTSDDPAGAISSDGDLIITGSGSATITSNGDGVHADGLVQIDGGTLGITALEGIEGTYVKINGGDISINASDDGINATSKSTAYSVRIEINGGNITINMGQGDTDAIDSNGDIYINGGTLNITAQSPFDYDGTAKYTGGTIIINGEQTTEITNQMMGEMGGGMMPGNRGQLPPDQQQTQQNQQTQQTQQNQQTQQTQQNQQTQQTQQNQQRVRRSQ